MTQIRAIGLIGIVLMALGSLATMGNPAGVGLIGLGGTLLAFAVFMMFSEIHETITSEEEE